MNYIGLMSGTSVDAIDAVILSIPDTGKPAVQEAYRLSYPNEVKRQIHDCQLSPLVDLEQYAQLDVAVGRLFAEAANGLLQKAGLARKDIRAIGSHGQTIRHRPQVKYPFSVQIGNPSVIAERTGISTVADFRARDIAAGGQGAPLVPAFHQQVFRSPDANRVIVNIGGIANVSYLPANPNEAVIGFDTGPGNTLLDQWIERHLGNRYDQDGEWAAAGKFSQELLDELYSDPYFHIAPPKSTGREYFNLAWFDSYLNKQSSQHSPQDIHSTLAELTIHSIVKAIEDFLPVRDEVYICGGGAHNRFLLSRLTQELADTPLATTEAFGLNPDWVEAAACAWLAYRTINGYPGSLPSVTGAGHPVVLGGIYKSLGVKEK